MADRGRKAFPVSSHLCDERWQRHCMDLHKQRLSDMKHRIDNTKPETFDLVLSKGKRQMLDKERQTEVDRENAILLQKMVRIKEQDTRAVFRPWTARSTFQWKVGHYYDPATNTKTLDHINLTSSVSPRSIHYFALTRPGTAPPDVTARLRDMEIQVDNTKLLRAITTMRTHYSNEEFERRHAEESILVSRISNFRGPDGFRYQPPGRSISASRNSPYLQPLPGRASSSNRPLRPPAPRAGWPASSPPISQQQYYEDAQNRDIPLPSGRGNSRPGTALGGTQEGLGETSPRPSGSSRGHSASSRSSASSRGHTGVSLVRNQAAQGPDSEAGSRPGSAAGDSEEGSSRPGSAAAAGTSFSFAGKQAQQQQRKASASSEGRNSASASSSSSSGSKRSAAGGVAAAADPGASADDYADEQYEEEGSQYEQEEEERREEAEEERSDRRESRSTSGRGSGRESRSSFGRGSVRESRSSSGRGSGRGPQDDGEEAGNSGYGDDEFAADDGREEAVATAAAAAEEDEDDGGYAEAKRRGYEEDVGADDAERTSAGGDDDRPARAGDEEAEEEQGEAAGSEAKSKKDDDDDHDADKEAAAFDPAEAELRFEMKAAEEAEMDQQFAAEMAADTYGNLPMASPQVGGFAADWD
ncbi:hypothetical protein PLESTB_000799900 [Pleodorina starrii]|uniref:Uncharacterized protein n=1 Tax=Pleodorina starrii TaxID=330485 RepID=A0A9W6BKJ5_9CHLO|nr:hypothetical protein PLESTM_000633800 [Pleodorina starrii]GLC53882.1 hypothetical protein PLESTB_000799900 [Pleodorina starrii]GLC75432.1 hypothetical protein PLESTF_001636100 [Pleodorina starrii]